LLKKAWGLLGFDWFLMCTTVKAEVGRVSIIFWTIELLF